MFEFMIWRYRKRLREIEIEIETETETETEASSLGELKCKNKTFALMLIYNRNINSVKISDLKIFFLVRFRISLLR